MSEIVIPKFGELLAPYVGAVPHEAYPFLLSELERTAADRYGDWATANSGAQSWLNEMCR